MNFDDPGFVEDNYLIYLHPAETFYQSLSNTIRGNWVPLTFTSFSIEYHLYGLNGPAFHLTNILFHGLNAILVFLITSILFKDFYRPKNVPGINPDFFALLATILWAVHPLRVEAVTWISARKDVLSMFFCFLSILSYIYFLHQKPLPLKKVFANKLYLAVTLMMILSLLAKGMAVTLPAVFLIFDYLYQRKDYIRAICEKVPLFFISLFFAYIQISTRPENLPGTNELALSTRIINSFSGLGFYIEKTLLPIDLIPIYYYEGHKSQYFIYIFITAVAAAVLLTILFLKGNRFVKGSILFYLVTALPIIGIMQTWIQEYADRFSYLPTIPLYLWIGVGLMYFCEGTSKKSAQSGHSSKKPQFLIVYLLSFILIGIYGYQCSKQIMYWENPYTLWNHQLDIRPSSRTCLVLGDYSMTLKDTKKAYHYYQYGYQLDPKDSLIIERIILFREITGTEKK